MSAPWALAGLLKSALMFIVNDRFPGNAGTTGPCGQTGCVAVLFFNGLFRCFYAATASAFTREHAFAREHVSDLEPGPLSEQRVACLRDHGSPSATLFVMALPIY